VPINTGLAHFSNDLLLIAVVVYAVAMLAYACDFAFGKKPAPAVIKARVPELVSAKAAAAPAGGAGGVGVGGAGADEPGAGVAGARVGGAGAGGAGAGAVVVPGQRLGRGPAGFWVTTAVILTSVGLAAHFTGVLTRGLAVHRLPWGDMYEFVTALTCVAMAFFLGAMVRYRAYYLGLFVTAAVVLVLGLALLYLTARKMA